ncbi:acetylcholinesterase-like isoform X2 [Watersipora subatra]|uniref:acetylcholinesterase-like isoform X2 n=1 Tax=Watersipora subatra TaxID=2589382 RepID=UPI00355BDACA
MGKPPVGNLRFKRPEPVGPWPGVFRATKRSNACYNVYDGVFGKFAGSDMWNPYEPQSEDCLYINAWVPNPDDQATKKPIMVWIYGGGFYSGSSTLDVYDGRYLAASQNVIVISMQYRLGILGFLNLESEDAPGNMGLLDQVMGLQWTQDNADFLYGDKNNVTILGESAGSVSVSLHLISTKSRNLFNRAIMQSGTSVGDWTLMSSESSWYRLNTTIFGADVGCKERTSHVPTLMKCLRSVDAGALFNGTWAPTGLIQFSWLPSIDYYFLSEKPETSLREGRFKRCPILIGSNENEGSWFLVYEFYDEFHRFYNQPEISFPIPYSKHVEYMDQAFKYYPQWPEHLNKFGKDAITFRYTDWRNKDDSTLNLKNLDMAVSDYHFLCPTNKYAHYFVLAGLDVYYYYFRHRSSRNEWGEWMGVMHGDEVAYMFGVPIRPDSSYTDDEKALSMHMMQLWANFSKTGNPNSQGDRSGRLDWPTATPLGREYYELSVESMNNPTYGSGPRTEYCAFWEQYLPKLVVDTDELTSNMCIDTGRATSSAARINPSGVLATLLFLVVARLVGVV